MSIIDLIFKFFSFCGKAISERFKIYKKGGRRSVSGGQLSVYLSASLL